MDIKLVGLDIRNGDVQAWLALALLAGVTWLSLVVPAGTLSRLPGLARGYALLPAACILPLATLFGWTWLRPHEPDPVIEQVRRVIFPVGALFLAGMTVFVGLTPGAAFVGQVQKPFQVFLPLGMVLESGGLSDARFLLLAGSALACAWLGSAAAVRGRRPTTSGSPGDLGQAAIA